MLDFWMVWVGGLPFCTTHGIGLRVSLCTQRAEDISLVVAIVCGGVGRGVGREGGREVMVLLLGAVLSVVYA